MVGAGKIKATIIDTGHRVLRVTMSGPGADSHPFNRSA
jgi:hypothetical protein